MPSDRRAPDLPSLTAFSIAVMLGAGNFIAVSFSNEDLDPFWGAGLRFSLAAAIFVIVVLVLRLPLPRGRDLWLTAAFGMLSITVFYALMYWALVRVTAGLATVVMAVVPLATLLLAGLQRQERVGARGAVGALLACAGILWITLGSGVDLPFTALVAMLGAAVAVAESVILGKRLSGNHPAVTNALAMTVGAPLLLVASIVVGETWVLPTSMDTIVAVTYLVTFGSVGLFVLILLVVRRWKASASAYMFVLFPLVTLVLDAVVRAEPITFRTVSGAVVVMVGVWFGALSANSGVAWEI